LRLLAAQFVRSRRDLLLEDMALRQQLTVLKRRHPQPQLEPSDRLFRVVLKWLWRGWKNALILVQPETVVRGHRAGFKAFWAWLSRYRAPAGRKLVSKELRELIFRMVVENPTLGCPTHSWSTENEANFILILLSAPGLFLCAARQLRAGLGRREIGALVAGKQPLHQRRGFALESGIIFAGSGSGVSGVDGLHEAVAADEERGWPAVQAFDAGEFLIELVRCASHDDRIGDAEFADHGTEACEIRELRGFLEADLDDLKALIVVALVERFEEGRFILAVGAPASAGGDDDHLVVELRIGARDHLAGEVGEAKGERLRRICERCVAPRIVGGLEAGVALGGQAMRGKRLKSVAVRKSENLERAVGLRFQHGV
jgi:hypothetical protein